jgi:hypothetical protein
MSLARQLSQPFARPLARPLGATEVWSGTTTIFLAIEEDGVTYLITIDGTPITF